MLASNPAFMGVVNNQRSIFSGYLAAARVADIVYPSKHFFERLVERNIDAGLAFIMVAPVIKDFRSHTFNIKSYLVQWRNLGMVAIISVGTVSERRQIILKTVFDKYNEEDYDVTIRI